MAEEAEHEEVEEATSEQPATADESMMTMLEHISSRVGGDPRSQYQAKVAMLPPDRVLVKLIETVPLSAVTNYLATHQYTGMQVVFDEWRNHGTNKALPMSEPAYNKITYFVFLWNYQRFAVRQAEEGEGRPKTKNLSLLHRIVSSYQSHAPIDQLFNRGVIEAELASDVGVPIDEWDKGLKFSRYGLVNMTRVNPNLTLDEALAVLAQLGVQYDREIASYSQRGLSDLAVLSIVLAAATPTLTQPQHQLVETFFGVTLSDVVRINTLVHGLVQQYKMAYLSNYNNIQIGRVPA